MARLLAWSWRGVVRAAALAACLVTGAGGAWAQEGGEEPELETDRPDFTETAVVVPQGSLQVESGFTWEKSGEARFWQLPELLLRYGVGPRTEIRFGPPDFLSFHGGERFSGFGDTYVGMKQQLGPTRGGLGLALIPGVTLPTGSRRLTSGAVEPELLVAWSKDVARRTSAAGVFGLFWPVDEGGRRFAPLVTLTLAQELSERVGGFAEYVGEFPEGQGDAHLLHLGLTYALTRRSQADFHFAFGLNRAAPDFLIGAGYSFRH